MVKNVNSTAAGTSNIAARAKMRGRCENLDFTGPGAGKMGVPHHTKRQFCCRTEALEEEIESETSGS
jgi:hypothetical protein